MLLFLLGVHTGTMPWYVKMETSHIELSGFSTAYHDSPTGRVRLVLNIQDYFLHPLKMYK